MPVEAHEEGTDIVVLRLTGRMTPADQVALLKFVTAAIQRAGRIRPLILLDGFEGWTGGEEWADMELRLAHDEPIIRAAIVGEPRWKDEVFAFIGKPFRGMPIEYFDSEEAARTWLVA